LEKKLHNAQLWAAGAKARSRKAGQLYHRRWQQTKEYGDQQYLVNRVNVRRFFR
jgi:hypothetical protein